jgi:ABC-type transporter Mla subunit MlaD
MRTDRNALKSGVFIIVTICLIIAIIIGIQGAANFGVAKQVRTVSFALADDIGGLQNGDEVRVGGYKVGTVRSISVAGADNETADQPPRVRVEFTFPRQYVLRHDALLRIQSTVTGQSCLNFESLGQGAKLPPEEELAGHPGTLSEVLATVSKLGGPVTHIVDNVEHKTLPQVNDTIARFAKTADRAADLITTTKNQIAPAMQSYQRVMATANDALAKIGNFFGDTTTDFRTTLAKLASICTSVEKRMPALLDKFDGILTKADTAVASADDALVDIKKIASDGRDVVQSARSILVGNHGKIEAMIAALKATSKNLEAATVEIRRSPWRLLYKPAPNEMANLNLYDAARQFADGATELNDASLALHDALKDGHADPQAVDKLVHRLQNSFDNFQKVEDDLWNKVKQ